MRSCRFCSVFFIIFFLLLQIALAQDAKCIDAAEKTEKFPVNGFIAFSLNTMIAESREYVCYYGAILSDLKWPLTPSLSYTIHGGIYFPKGIHVEGNISFMQPMATASMTDTDFEGILKTSPQTGITKFSEHNCMIIGGLSITAKLGLQLPMPQTDAMQSAGVLFTVEPMLSFYYSTLGWTSYGGYLQYAKENHNGTYEPWTNTLSKVPHTGQAVSYQQHIIIPVIGIGFETTLPHKLTLFSDFHLTADLIAWAEDIHYARNMRFVDVLSGGWAMHGSIRLDWNCMPFLAVFINLFYQYCISMEGRSISYAGITSTKPDSFTPPNSAGTALRGCTCSIGCAFRIGR